MKFLSAIIAGLSVGLVGVAAAKTPGAPKKHKVPFVAPTATAPLPEFAFRECTLAITDAAGRPVPAARVYGWSPDFNLIWPRVEDGEDLATGRGIVWEEESLGSTADDGTIKINVPPGRWGFLAAGKSATGAEVIVAWSDFKVPAPGETLRLAGTTAKRWTLCSAEGVPMAAKRLFFKPQGFPIWMPADLGATAAEIGLQMPPGSVELFAEGDCGANGAPGFAMSWGNVSSSAADGKLAAPTKAGTIAFQGTNGNATVLWRQRNCHGLSGDIELSTAAKVMFTPGEFAVGYRRAITPAVRGEFGPLTVQMKSDSAYSMNLGGSLSAELDQDHDKSTPDRLFARLYVVDANGRPLRHLTDNCGREVRIAASALVNGQAYPASQKVVRKSRHATLEKGDTLFEAKFTVPSSAAVTWQFQAPEGVLPKLTFTAAPRVGFAGQTFETEAPAIIAPQGRYVMTQADATAAAMEAVTGRKRTRPVTILWIEPGHTGASASHNGEKINFSTSFFLDDEPTMRHTFVHELAHNFALTHGGMMETVVEATRSYGGPQISGQVAKWLFFDRMNSKYYPEVPYANTGLYLYCYAMGGPPFLRFLLANETPVKSKLSKGTGACTDDELTVALLSLALNRDASRICAQYGLSFNPERQQMILSAVRGLCKQP